MSKKNIVITALSVICLQSCLPGETPVPAHDSGDVLTATVNMESDYKWQIYYNLRSNKEVSKNNKDIWDLGFETGAEGYRVILNTAKLMAAYPTGKSDFGSVQIIDTAGKVRRDSPSGSLDSTAIGNWQGSNTVYIIDCGSEEFKKVQFLSVNDRQYTIRVADINGDNDQTITVTKDDRFNFTFLSLKSGLSVSVEPPKETWDIAFSQYTYIYYHLDNTPYMVTGCLLNRYNTAVAVDSISSFADITLDNVPSYSFSTNIDAIGFNWKAFSLDNETYTVNLLKNYIIRTSEGKYFKLHFIDFVSPSGEKGNPKWEFQEL